MIRPALYGGYYIAGSAYDGDGAFLLKMDNNFEEEWRVPVPYGRLWGKSADQSFDGGYAICGYTQQDYGTNIPDVIFIKTDAHGNVTN